MKNLFNVLFCVSGRSPVRIPQAIGRSLRPMDGKIATIYDIVDQFGYPLKHYYERKSMYMKEGYPIEEVTIDIVEWCKKHDIPTFD